jgi:hypothetical protein
VPAQSAAPGDGPALQIPVEGRVLTGTYCPYCHAEMTLADLSRRACAICGALVVPEALRLPPGPIHADTLGALKPPQELRTERWPDDAPIW